NVVQEQERSLPKLRSSRAGFATRSTFQPVFSCNSPSSTSTTSLAQLREKLTKFTPVNFTKVPARIAATPELPILIEEEYDKLSSSEPKRRCGVLRNIKHYHSDSEIQIVIKNTRDLQPIVEERSANLLPALDATANTDQSAIVEAFEQLHNKDAPVNLVDLLEEEALNHEQDKDSGLISGKVTQEIEEIGYTTDDSDVVDDTPCYDYDWRKRCRNKSDKTNKNNNDENETIIENTHFCQQQQDIIHLISLATIKRISESLSRDEDSEDDCCIIDDIEIVTEKESELNLAVEADIIDCVNYLLDKVSNDIDTHVDLLVEQQQQIGISRAVHNIDKTNNTSKILKMNNNTLKSPKDITNELNTPEKSTYRQKKAKCVKPPNNVEEDSDCKSPMNATTQVIQKKRKLYSPKDDDNENNEIPRSRKKRRPSSSTESPIAACYKELENARKSRIRLPRKRASTQPVTSPKTKKLNDMFDIIKDSVVNNEKITLVNKKSDKDLSLYNMSSESDDELFQKKNTKVQKCISLSSLESVTKRRRSVKPVDYTSYYSSQDECQRVVKKAGKQTKPRSRKAKITQRTDLIDERMRNDQPEVLETSFVQEKGNMNVPEEPQPSVNVPVLETMPTGDIYDEPIVSRSKPQTPNKQEIKTEKSLKKRCVNLTKPTITKRSKEIIADHSHDESIVSGRKPHTPNKQGIIKIETEKSLKNKFDKLTKPTLTKKSNEIIKNVPTERESATVSPLPGLVVETVPPKDENTSLDANLLQKLIKIYTDLGGLNTTSDTQLSVPAYNLQAGDIPDVNSEKSIETGGRSPITGHNDLDESPPNLDALNESFQYRDIDVEGKSKSITEFLVNMRREKCAVKSISCHDIESQINPVSPKSKVSASTVVLTRMSSEDIEKLVTPTQSSTTKSLPVIVLKRISPDEIDKWLPMPKTKDIIEIEPEVGPRKTLARRKSVLKPCISCESIYPVKLNFDTVDLTNKTSIRDTRSNRTVRSRTRSSVKTVKSRSDIEKLRTEGVESLAEEVNDQGISSQETVGKSAETKNISNEKTVGSTVDQSEMGSSVASVQSWLEKNAEAGSSKKGDKSIKKTKEILYEEVMEVLNTRLVEINERTNEAMQAAAVKDQEELKCLEECIDSLKEQINAYRKNKMDRACSLIRADAEKKALMVLLLKEDIERGLKY
ncbi:uncharacterized protein LOC134748494, partial [Cydia strobilella]|uniref:uncharacterized protein LOC134748494 n=1 Tax=Cydia strobilella TaxID=1100964 RepID=UPI003004A2B1